jgi:hypothetical protein
MRTLTMKVTKRNEVMKDENSGRSSHVAKKPADETEQIARRAI